MPAEQEPRYIEAEGDKPKVERTRHYFAAIYAGLKTAEEYGRELTLENELLQAELQAAQELARDLVSYSHLREKVRLREDATEYEEAERLIARFDALAAQRTEESGEQRFTEKGAECRNTHVKGYTGPVCSCPPLACYAVEHTEEPSE